MASQIAQDQVPPPIADRASTAHPAIPHVKSTFTALAVGSIGVVYGDIGTSPLYALRESLIHSQKAGITDEGIIGTVSLLLWALFSR